MPVCNKSPSSTESGSEKPSNLPLNSNHPLLAMMMATGDQSGRDKVTPQQAMIQTMAAMHQKVRLASSAATIVVYPSF